MPHSIARLVPDRSSHQSMPRPSKRFQRGEEKRADGRPRPMKCEGNFYLQRGTVDAAALGGKPPFASTALTMPELRSVVNRIMCNTVVRVRPASIAATKTTLQGHSRHEAPLDPSMIFGGGNVINTPRSRHMFNNRALARSCSQFTAAHSPEFSTNQRWF